MSDDRVLVAYVPHPTDFEEICQHGWYRIPHHHAPKGIYAEWIAFYFGRNFGHQKYAIHYVAPNDGHELTRRIDLLPNEPEHPRAEAWYYKIQLGELQPLARPIVSLRWRRILFIHTTGDRFTNAVEINDLLLDGDEFVDRQFTTLRESATIPYCVSSPNPTDE